jgi:hypothetical protein
MNKKFVIPLVVMFAIGLVVAGVYYVNSLTLTVGVAEPFTILYAIRGDAGNYNGITTCEQATNYFTSDSQSIPTGNFYPMESRAVCVKITNAGEAIIPYTITSVVTNDNQNNDCANAFGLPRTLTGSAIAQGVTYDGAIVQIAAGATPVEGCNVVISVGRGTA